MWGDKVVADQKAHFAEFRQIGKVIADWGSLIRLADEIEKKENGKKVVTLEKRVVDPHTRSNGLEGRDLTKGNIDAALFTRVNTEKDFPLYRLKDFLGIEGGSARVNKQMPGQMFPFHIDNLKGPMRDFPGVKPEEMIRLQCAMSVRRWGHIYKFGFQQWEWEPGDVVWFDWENAAHGTCNIDDEPRYIYQITGRKTARTRQVLEETKTRPFILDLTK